MDYPFENLDPETFQQFCQALVAREYKHTQCFPVAQPDGGRDAIAYMSTSDRREFIMFQIKFKRNPQNEADPHKWLADILEDEAPKVKAQIPRIPHIRKSPTHDYWRRHYLVTGFLHSTPARYATSLRWSSTE